jgi:predicted DNA-binding transcriptional regulator YafY
LVFCFRKKTKPISPFQKQKILEDGSLEVRLKLIPNKKLYALLMSYGSEVSIIKPQYLIDRIKEEYRRRWLFID